MFLIIIHCEQQLINKLCNFDFTFPSPSRCSDHRRSPCTVCGSATVATIPLQARFVPLCAFRSINAPSIAFPVLQASSAVSTSCLSRQPHKACCCHSPLRSLTGVANANELPQLLPGVRGLTTTFRSDGQTTLPCLQCRLLAPLQSVVRSLATSPP